MDRPRILYVTPSLGESRGGPSTMVTAMARGLEELGCSVTIATTDDDGRSRRDPSQTWGPGYDIKVFRRRLHFYTIAPALTRWLRREAQRYDIVHVFALFSYPLVPAVSAAREAQIPYVVSPLGSLNQWALARYHPLLKRASIATVERRVMRDAAAIHFNSDDEAEQAAKVVRFRRTVVIPPPVAPFVVPPEKTIARFRESHPEIQGRRVVLFLSRIDATKGLDQLIPAFADLSRGIPDALLLIAGDGPSPLVAEVDDSIRKHRLHGHAIRVGFLTGEEKRAALTVAHVLVQPSHTENFGISVAEAMAAGVPVVVTSTSGVSKIVRESNAGVVVAPAGTEIRDGLARLLNDDGARTECSARARKAADHYFAPRSVASRLVEVYQDAIRSHERLRGSA